MFRVVTIAREYGSGGGRIAQLVAARLGWRLVDRCLVDKIAETARVAPEIAERFDEHPDQWLDRLANVLWQAPGLRGYIGGNVPGRFNGDTAAELTRRIIEEAAQMGDCVIVGRGSQCILQQRQDAFHVFVYAPRQERLERLLHRDLKLSKAEAERKMIAEDETRAAYVRDHYGENWENHHLYHLMLSSSLGEREATSIVLSALHLAHTRPAMAT
jgi:cytidylate kinase